MLEGREEEWSVKLMFKWAKTVTPSHVEQLIRVERDINKALLIFDSATAEYTNGFKHDLNTFRFVISKMVSANQFRLADTLLDRMKEIILMSLRIYFSLFVGLMVVSISHWIPLEFSTKCRISIASVFAILVEENQSKLAFRSYRYMRKMGIPPTVASVNVLIKALCKNSGTMDSAMYIFREMSNHRCEPDSYTYGTLINGLCRLGNIVKAKELLREMETKGFSPSVVTYTSMIHGLCRWNG